MKHMHSRRRARQAEEGAGRARGELATTRRLRLRAGAV